MGQTYDNNKLVLNTSDPNLKQLGICISTSIMTNYEPSRAIDSRHKIMVAEDAGGHPIVFSIGNQNELYVLLNTGKTDSNTQKQAQTQVQADISSCLGSGWTVQTFGMIQLDGGNIYLAVAMQDTANTCHFFVTGALSNNPEDAVWKNPFTNASWIGRSFTENFQRIDHILMTPGKSPEGIPTLLVTATLARLQDQAERYYVDMNLSTTDDTLIWKEAELAVTSQKIIDLAVGSIRGIGPGSFTLSMSGETPQLIFTASEKTGHQLLSRALIVPDGARALGTLQNPDGTTDLFIAGNGLYVYTAANMHHNPPPPVQIAATLSADEGTELIVRQDDKSIAVWILDQGVLSYVQGTKSTTGGAPAWTVPLKVQNNIGQIAALRGKKRGANDLFTVNGDKQLMHFYQDPISTAWRKMQVPLTDVGNVLSYQCYTTQITLRDQDNKPVADRVFSLSASQFCYLTINGVTCICDTDTLTPITTNKSGSITIISKVTELSTSTVSLHADFLTAVVDINPQAIVNGNLKGFSKEGTLKTATTQDGKPVYSDSSKLSADVTEKALGKLTAIHDSSGGDNDTGVSTRTATAKRSNLINGVTLKPEHSFGISGLATGNAQFHDHNASPKALSDLHAHAARAVNTLQVPHHVLYTSNAGDDMLAFFGDVFQTIINGLENVGDFVVDTEKEIATLTIKLAEGVATIFLDTLEKVMHAITWLLEQIEMAIEKLIEWIGFLLNWGDIIKAHEVIVNIGKKSLDYAESILHKDAQTLTNNFFTKAKSGLGGMQPIASATTSFKSQNDSNIAKTSDSSNYGQSPGGNFTSYHTQHSGVLDAKQTTAIAAVLTGDPIVDTFSNTVYSMFEGVVVTIKDLMQEIADGFQSGSLSPADFMKKLMEKAFADLLDIAKRIVDALLKIAQTTIDAIRSALTTEWDIPLISELYKLFSGGATLTVLDAIALILAIPTVPLYKILTGKAPFDNAHGLDDTKMPAEDFFKMFSPPVHGSRTRLRSSMPLDGGAQENAPAKTEDAGTLYSQVGGGIYCFAEFLAFILDGYSTEADEKQPEFVTWCHLGLEFTMLACSFPIGDGVAVDLLRSVWGCNLFSLVRFVFTLRAHDNPLTPKIVGGFELVSAAFKIILFSIAIDLQNKEDEGTTLDLDWATFITNICDGLARSLSGIAKFVGNESIVTKEECEGAALVLALGVFISDLVRLGVVIKDDTVHEYHCF